MLFIALELTLKIWLAKKTKKDKKNIENLILILVNQGKKFFSYLDM